MSELNARFRDAKGFGEAFYDKRMDTLRKAGS